MNEQNEYSDLWSEMDEMLIEHPELSDLWLDADKLAALRAKFTNRQELTDYYRKRAFTSLVIENIFRIFDQSQETEVDQEGMDTEGITLDNPELWRIWSEDVRDEYSDYPEFIEYVDKNVFEKAGP